MSEFKSTLRNKAQATVYAFLPALAISAPYPETLQKWDELLQTHDVSVFGGTDAHGMIYRMGPISRAIQPYNYLFRCINTHLLTEEPLSGDLLHDKAMIYRALQRGRRFLGYERPGAIAGFTFWIRSGDAVATMGEMLHLHRSLELHVRVPRAELLRVLCDGEVLAQSRGEQLSMESDRTGAYRVEVYRMYLGKRRGWIFSNPICVRD